MPRSSAVDGFSLAYDRTGEGPPVVLLHGWPGGRTDYREVVPLLADVADLVVPDLRGFGESDTHLVPPDEGYTAAAQARSVTGLLDELGLGPVVLAGYEIGSRIAQTVASRSPSSSRAERSSRWKFWYQNSVRTSGWRSRCPAPGIGGAVSYTHLTLPTN